MERKHEFNPNFHQKKSQKANLLHDRNLRTKKQPVGEAISGFKPILDV